MDVNSERCGVENELIVDDDELVGELTIFLLGVDAVNADVGL